MTAAALDTLCRAAAARGEVVLYLPPNVRRYYTEPALMFVAVRPPGGVK